MLRSVIVFLGVLAVVGAAASLVRGQEDAVPVYHEPHHRMVFEAGSTRVLDGQIPPGDASLFHTHTHPILYITLSSSQVKTEVLGEADAGGRAGAGRGGDGRGGAEAGRGAARGTGRGRGPSPSLQNAVAPNVRLGSTTSYIEHPITHRISNVGDRLFRFIAVINESAGSDVAEDAAGFSGEAELTNHWFRAYRFAIAPGETTPMHHHTAPVVLVQVSDGRGLAIGPMKWELNEPGRWAWFDAGSAHEVRNVGNSRVEFIEVEMR
jgi:quercetin dioxygenase-like cupin family protein